MRLTISTKRNIKAEITSTPEEQDPTGCVPSLSFFKASKKDKPSSITRTKVLTFTEEAMSQLVRFTKEVGEVR